MTTPDEATPKLIRFNLFMGRLFFKLGAYAPGELAMEKIEEVIAERDAALAKVEEAEDLNRIMHQGRTEYYRLMNSAIKDMNTLQQQVTDLRIAIAEILTGLTNWKPRNDPRVQTIVDVGHAALAATEVEEEGS